MNRPYFIDANIPIYAAGSAHPLKDPAIRILRLAAQHPDSFLTSAEVLQELIHYYSSRNRWELGYQVLHRFAAVISGRIESVRSEDALRAAEMVGQQAGVSARDWLHAAVMQRAGTNRIVSADQNLDRIPWLERLDPKNVADLMARFA